MVLMKSGETLYKGTCQLISDNLEKLAKQYIIPAFPSGTGDLIQRSQEGEMLLKAIRKVWDDHTSSLSKLSDVLKYMVRSSRLSDGRPNNSLWIRIVYIPSLQASLKYGAKAFCYTSNISSALRYRVISYRLY